MKCCWWLGHRWALIWDDDDPMYCQRCDIALHGCCVSWYPITGLAVIERLKCWYWWLLEDVARAKRALGR